MALAISRSESRRVAASSVNSQTWSRAFASARNGNQDIFVGVKQGSRDSDSPLMCLPFYQQDDKTCRGVVAYDCVGCGTEWERDRSGAFNAVYTLTMGLTCLGIGFLINRFGSASAPTGIEGYEMLDREVDRVEALYAKARLNAAHTARCALSASSTVSRPVRARLALITKTLAVTSARNVTAGCCGSAAGCALPPCPSATRLPNTTAASILRFKENEHSF